MRYLGSRKCVLMETQANLVPVQLVEARDTDQLHAKLRDGMDVNAALNAEGDNLLFTAIRAWQPGQLHSDVCLWRRYCSLDCRLFPLYLVKKTPELRSARKDASQAIVHR